MIRHDIRLMVSDLDGTLIGDDETISQENLDALQQARARGVLIALCSGRDAKNMSDIALAAGIEDCAILSLNGAYVLDEPHGNVLEDYRMDTEAAKRCLDVLIGNSGELLVAQADHFALYHAPRYRRVLQNPQRQSVPTHEDNRAALYAMAEEGVHKFVYSDIDHPERLIPLRKQLMDIPKLDITSSWFTNIELMPEGVHKGFAVARLAARLNIRMEQVIAFGDNDNDAPMLAHVGYGIAMGNAADAARSAARYTTDTNLRNGVAKGIERFVLSSEWRDWKSERKAAISASA